MKKRICLPLFYLLILLLIPISASAEGKLHVVSINGRSIGKPHFNKLSSLLNQNKIPNYTYDEKKNTYSYNTDDKELADKDKQKEIVDNIYATIDRAFSGNSSNDISFFYYSGHGITPNSKWNSGIPIGYYNGAFELFSSKDNEKIMYDDLLKKLASYEGRIVVIMDCCYSGCIIERAKKCLSPHTLQKFLFITSADKNSVVTNGTFSKHMYNFLSNYSKYQKYDANKDGGFSLNETMKYLQKKMKIFFFIPTNPQYTTNVVHVGDIMTPLFQFNATKMRTPKLSLTNGKSVNIKCSTLSTLSPYISIKYKSSNKQVATVNQDGKVTAKQEGVTVITSYLAYGNTKFCGTESTCEVTVSSPSIKLNKTKASIFRNESLQLTAKVGSKKLKKVTWKSSNKNIAAVSSKGLVKGRKAGTVTITAKANGKTAKCKITVTNPSIKLNKTSVTLNVSESVQLKATVSGKSKKVSWKSSNTSVASVKSGKVIAKKAGTVKVTAKANGKTATCKVTVKMKKNVKVIDVSCGYSHTAILKADGSLWMCGSNGSGQLGNGITSRYDIAQSTPIKIMDNVKAVSCGHDHTAILKTDGSLWMCGNNYYGQLGDGTNISKNKPAKIMSNVKSVNCGDYRTAILKTDGSLWMCGYNVNGELGNGTNISSNKPIKVMNNVKSVSCGLDHTAIIKNDGSLWMCGNNDYGQLGDSRPLGLWDINRTFAKIMDNVKAVSCGSRYTAILKTDGSLLTCGSNSYGQLGNGGIISTWEKSITPTKITGNIKIISCSSVHTAILKTDGSLWMCGYNEYGQLGDGTYEDTNKPINIISNVKNVSCGWSHTAILKTDGSLWMCGYNEYGQLGDGTTVDKTIPAKIM